jgi:hypothetical protein
MLQSGLAIENARSVYLACLGENADCYLRNIDLGIIGYFALTCMFRFACINVVSLKQNEGSIMTYTPEQVGQLMRYSHCFSLAEAAQKAGMSVATAKKYIKAGGEIRKPPDRTRADQGAFTEVWDSIEERLGQEPGLRATEILAWLIEEHPEEFHRGQLRTLQRLVRDWLCLYGPEKEVFFEQTDGSVI